MQHNPRQKEILLLVQRRGFVSNEDLAQAFNVTPQTIRRDINQLCLEGLLRRYHGGAGLPSSVENVAYKTRQVICLEEKRRIAKAVAYTIPDQASLFINIGTTTEEVAKALQDHRDLHVITNNLNVAAILSQNSSFEVIIAGGVVRSRDLGITGDATIDFMNDFKVDFGIIGISGIDMDGSLLDFDYSEVRVAQAIIRNSRKVFLVADYTKFGRTATVRLGRLSQMDALFTDRKPPQELISILTDANGKLHVAGD
jgi:DeoR family glycerol-3-phosphate regulon repressor